MKKILIFSNGEKIGDGLIKLPFIREIYSQFEHSHITWLVYGTTVYATTLKNISSKYVNEIIDNSKLNLFPWNNISNNYDFSSKSYDIIIDTQKTVYKTLALRRIKSKIFVSSTASWFFSNVKPKVKAKVNKYYLENLFDMLELVIEKKLNKSYDFSFPKNLENQLKILFDSKKKYIGIAPGSGEKNKKWNINNFIIVANHFIKKGYEIAFFIGPEDLFEKNIILKNFPEAFFPEDYIKDFSGPEIVMASTKYLKFSLSNDSGVSHMLSTNLSPILKLFSQKDPIKFTPNMSNIKTISSKNFGGNDINSIPPKKVIEIIDKYIK